MNRAGFWGLLLAAIALSAPGCADEPADTSAAGNPDTSSPQDFIAARQALMLAAEVLMEPIDTYTVDDTVEREEIQTSANSISAMLLAFPHLFPNSTNLYDPDADYPETLALPTVWQSYPAFSAMAKAASDKAAEIVQIYDADELRQASLDLRATCDACHAVYLRPYEPGTLSEKDRELDFDSLFDN